MSVIGKRVIFVGPADNSDHKPLNVEGVAVSAVVPGTVLKSLATGLDASDIAATVFGQLFLVADKDQQRSKSVDDPWIIDENMVSIQPRSGEFVNVLVASGNNITVPRTALSRNGAGLLKIAVTDGSEEIVAHADEIVNVTADALVCVRVA